MTDRAVIAVASCIKAAKRITERKWTFLAVFVLVFFVIVTSMAALDLLPDAPPAAPVAVAAPVIHLTSTTPVIQTAAAEEPVKVEISKIGLVATIANPTSTDHATLDAALLKGAVRYPTSAKLGEAGNVVLFGHSSYLPVVGNQAYKTFDGIQKLVAGDTITVYAAEEVYTYQVRSMKKESATSDAGIDLTVAGQVLTLVTCNSFATKSDRFVVTADFVESHPIP